MTDQVTLEIAAISRRLDARDRDGRQARVVVVSRRFDTTPARLWQALTESKEIPRWFVPISGDLRRGGRYQLEGNAGGEITVCTPLERVAITWEFGGETSWVDLRLAAEAGGTTLQLEHVALVKEEFWARFGPGAVGIGWDMSFFGLGRYLRTGETTDPQKSVAWMASEEGKAFMRASSVEWGKASAAGGTDPAAAREAAARASAAYAGEEDGPMDP